MAALFRFKEFSCWFTMFVATRFDIVCCVCRFIVIWLMAISCCWTGNLPCTSLVLWHIRYVQKATTCTDSLVYSQYDYMYWFHCYTYNMTTVKYQTLMCICETSTQKWGRGSVCSVQVTFMLWTFQLLNTYAGNSCVCVCGGGGACFAVGIYSALYGTCKVLLLCAFYVWLTRKGIRILGILPVVGKSWSYHDGCGACL